MIQPSPVRTRQPLRLEQLTNIERKRFHDVLERKHAELENGNRRREALAVQTSADALDQIQGGQERDFTIGTLDRNSKLLRQVDAKLNRIHAGTFGFCLDCEEEISMKRLAAVPWTASCIVCQEAIDRESVRPWDAAEELLVTAA
jgi:DnaK suppressor protein